MRERAPKHRARCGSLVRYRQNARQFSVCQTSNTKRAASSRIAAWTGTLAACRSTAPDGPSEPQARFRSAGPFTGTPWGGRRLIKNSWAPLSMLLAGAAGKYRFKNGRSDADAWWSLSTRVLFSGLRSKKRHFDYFPRKNLLRKNNVCGAPKILDGHINRHLIVAAVQ